MRRFQAALTERSLEITKIGKIALTILAVIITVLVYTKAQAKENESSESIQNEAFVKNTVFEELQKIESNSKYNLCQKQELDPEPVASKIDSISKQEKNSKKERIVYNLNSLYPVSKTGQNEVGDKSKVDQELKEDIADELKGTRMESMIDYIAMQDREIAALLVGIAKIESGYKHNYSYNFWGYAGGYYGFSSPEQAVSTVGKRLKELQDKGLNTPQKLVTTWKCGQSCVGHAPGSVQRWVNTVSGPYNRIAMK